MRHQTATALSRHASTLQAVPAVLALFAVGGFGALAIELAIALVVLAAVLDVRQRRMQRRQHDDIRALLAGQRSFGDTVLPVWAQQIESSRTQMDAAVSALTERFSGIVQQLGVNTRASSAGDGSIGLVAAFDGSHEALGGVVQSLQTASQSKAAMLDKVRDLVRFTDELQGMVDEVARIAQQTNLLALNAAIEAARAGEHGRSFAVVAQEVRALSNRSAETGRHIGQKIDAIGQAIRATCHAAQASLDEDHAATEASSAVIHGVLARLRASVDSLADRSTELQASRDQLQHEIGEALVHLQFQDRISQVMGHVTANMARAAPLLEESDACFAREQQLRPLDAAALLAELQASYAMAEERVTHDGESPAAAAAPAEEITFF